MPQPLIAVSADCPSFSNYTWHATPEQYLIAASSVAKLSPIIIPSLEAIDLDSILDCVDGVLITGARSNVHPQHYQQTATTAHEPFDSARDLSSFALIHAALERSLPLLAICRGIQELNVVLGGSLFALLHEVPGRDDHRSPMHEPSDAIFAIRQKVKISPNGLLASILEKEEILVNSVHQQGINHLSPRLRVEAKALDGTIEAVSLSNTENFVLGVQWHPEYWAENDETSRKIFTAFGQAVTTHQRTRQTII